MKLAIQYVRSLIYIVLIYLGMGILGIVFAPAAYFSRRAAFLACKLFCVWARWLARWLIGLRTEVRGPIPQGEVMVAAKHQSFLDILMIYGSVPAGKFIMKRELMWAPILGQYALRIGCVPVNRGKRGAAIKRMIADVAAGTQIAGQLIIYSQGTRVAPGARKPYKVGTYALYKQLGQPCVPAATNVGVFWPRHGIYRKPGTAVVEFLAPMAAGMSQADFMAHLETVVETRSDDLMREAGFEPDGVHH